MVLLSGKAHLVSKGYNQIEWVDYTHAFSPVAWLSMIRLMLAVSTMKNWHVHQLDVNNAFLHDSIEEEIFMKPPDCYKNVPPSHICKLVWSLYGLKQVSQQWNSEFLQFISFLGFVLSKTDYSLFTQ